MFEEKNWDPAFAERMAVHYDELKWLYAELYHNDQQAFDYFCSMLYEYYSQRSPVLKEWDQMHEEVPDWYKGNEMLGMLMYTSCFAGTLKGVRENLDYLQECGLNYVHLMPLLESPAGRSDGGYAVADFRKVQPELGTMEDLAELGNECHNRGMCVCTPPRTMSGPGAPAPERRNTRTGISSTMTGTSPTSSNRPCPRSSRRPRPGTSPGARRPARSS